MPQPLANGWQTDPAVDKLSRVRVPELMDCTDHPYLCAVVVPSLLHRLVAKWPSSPILFRSEQRSMFVAHPFQIGPELLNQARIIEQDRPSLATFPHNRQVFIVKREIDILHIEEESFTHAQTSFQKQTEEKSVTLTLGGNTFENAFNLVTLYASWLWRIEFHSLNFEHGIGIEHLVLMCPSEEPRHGGLFACSGSRTQMKMGAEEAPQDLRRYGLHRPMIERTQLR